MSTLLLLLHLFIGATLAGISSRYSLDRGYPPFVGGSPPTHGVVIGGLRWPWYRLSSPERAQTGRIP